VAERLFGIETEYAVSGLAGSAELERQELVGRLFELAKTELPHLPDRMGSGIFLANGSRFYVDLGLHPEMATPECANPWDVVRYIQAGERMLAGLLSKVESAYGNGAEVMCFRANVDYGGTRATWGCHESYLHRAEPALLPKQIIPHLVTRLIYTGAGGFNPLTEGPELTLSPRALHISRVISGDSTDDRGIFHTKNESLSGEGYHRLHVLCGESLCSETAAWLKVATTALVVAMMDAGLKPGDEVVLASPLEALRAVAADPQCRAKLKLAGGGEATALDIQLHYLSQAEAQLGKDFMPPWAPEACRRWWAVLEQLEGAPDSVATTLDWAIKRALYVRHARRRGMSLEILPVWSEVVRQLNAALEETEHRGRWVGVDFILSPASPILGEVARLTPHLREHGLEWQGLKRFFELGREFFEIDMRFGQLGDKGIFGALDRAGSLTHRVPGVDNIEHAMANPPAVGRGRLRGEAVRRLAGNNGRYRCDWRGVWDDGQRRVLDLSDPFAVEEQWQDLPPPQEDDGDELLADLLGLHLPLSRRLRRRAPDAPPVPDPSA